MIKNILNKNINLGMLSPALKNKIRENYANNNNNKDLELEAKFGNFSKNRFNSGLNRQTFNRVKAYFDKMSLSLDGKTTDYIMGKVRKSVDSNNIVKWITKERLWNEDIYDYNFRYSMSRETEISPITAYFSAEIIREKSRSSYLVFNNTVRIDITLVNSSHIKENKNDTTYEVEIELLSLNGLDFFEKAVRITLNLVLDTVVLYTEKERVLVSNEINSILGSNKKGYVDHYPLVQARNLKMRDIVYGGLIGNVKTGYSATIKIDGVRRMLYFGKTGVWLISSSSMTRITNVEIPILNGTILDGEMVPMEKRILERAPKTKFWFLAFDALAWNSDNSIQNNPHGKRMSYAQTVADNVKSDLLTVNTKSFYSFETPDQFFALMRNMFRDLQVLPYQQDGFMFTPENTVYNPHSDNFPLYKRKLTDYPDICKYKMKEELTIDLQIKWRADITSPIGRNLDLFTIEKNILIPFTKFQDIDFINPLTINLPSNSIVEYGYDYEKGILTPRRVRHDKERPNRRDVAEDVAEDIMNPIDEETMKGDNFALLRKYHNVIKKKLFDKNKGKTLLDIGSGYGGDLGKWKGFEKIVAVEPDPEHVEELKRRLITYNMQDKVRIVIAGGQETEKISREVENWLGGQADVVSSMLSLTFFWQNSELVDSLVRTINNNLKVGGKYIFLTMDGDLVEQTFEPAFNLGPVLNKLVLGPATLEYNSNLNPKELHINIKGTIVENQREWLVRLDDLKLRLTNFNLNFLQKADEEKFLNESETIMTRMYTYGSFTKIVETEIEIKNESNLSENKTKLSFVSETKLPSLIETKLPTLTETKLPPLTETKLPPLTETKLPPLTETKLPPLTETKLPPLTETKLPPLTETKLPPLTEIQLQVLEEEEELGSINVDEVEIVNTSWWDKDVVVRIGSLGDGSCLIHSILNGFLKIYQTNSNVKFRKNFAKNLRKDIANTLRKPDLKNPGKIYYETVANGSFPELYAQQLSGVDFKDVFGQKVDFSIAGLEKLFNSNANLGDEIYSFIADLLNIDLYVMRITNKDLYPHANTHKSGVPRRSIVVCGNGYHFETVALIKNKLYQTFFESDDPFIKKIREFSK
jgi:SAM-dependent methyltransferase